MRIMKRAAVAATGLATAAALTLGAAPVATAATIDQGFYPSSGHIYVDPVSVQVLAHSPAGDFAGVAADMVMSTVGPSTTVAVLSTIEDRVNRTIRSAATRPGSSVSIQWYIVASGGVLSGATINWA